MKSKLIKCTFDRKTGMLLNEEVSKDETINIDIRPVIDILLKGLIEYIGNEEGEWV